MKLSPKQFTKISANKKLVGEPIASPYLCLNHFNKSKHLLFKTKLKKIAIRENFFVPLHKSN